MKKFWRVGLVLLLLVAVVLVAGTALAGSGGPPYLPPGVVPIP